ncbi:MAG: DUF3795 domain-containing protein [Salinivirgaceae bacterium]|jgi:hypothetical protein|nr:DUF3795 domain-containing protein [Salinivirgaceae bacterium]
MIKMDAKQELKVSFCGLYCGNCSKFKKRKCPGCQENSKAAWCKIRTCCLENNYKSCADCDEPGINNCKKFNNPIGTLFGYIFNSDRAAGIRLIQDEGYQNFVCHLEEINRMAIPRRKK